MGRYILALDQGTTSSRAILFDRDGQIAALEQKEFPQHYPQSGWVEHDANDIWRSQLEVAQAVLKRHQVKASDIAAIGITNQRETTVVWDRQTGEPICPAIVWQDRRTAALCDRLRNEGHEALFARKTGLVLDAYFAGTKLNWILDNVAGARERAERGELAFGTVDSWLIYKLSGEHVADSSNASRSLLFDIHKQQWDDELLQVLDVPRALLPRVVASSGVAAHARAEWFGAQLPIAGIAGDQQAATFGQACLHEGMVKNTYGTGCFMLMQTGRQAAASKNKLLTTIGWSFGAAQQDAPRNTCYMLEGSIFVAGAVVQWLRDGLGVIEKSADIEPLAAQAPDNGGVYFVPAFTGLGTPYWDPYARGSISGLTRGSTKAHLARAALESIAYQIADVLEAMQKDAAIPLRELRVDGGAARNDLLMQFQADMLNVPVVRPQVTETTALGAAYLAGLAVGFWESQEQIAALWQVERRFEPRMGEAERGILLEKWHKAVACSRGWMLA
ncbi:glycerol kinase GlpK [Herbaspirillum sp. LeCh32-8]|uniref:glycerol kinase GlpK n=1 Tax=Herbaspirillum sp. LeCh32-8 TaxID=2821356 RepID=UPI001AE43868|nr:glycerol kinase GlpK [Herbaspirillum sp. LeCh32-8]MBP0600433.1 glycerol kinase GlpK [Herbaspirillum sp. LeCh32-8]